MRVHACGVTVQLDGTEITNGCDLIAEPGQIVGLVGPNGSGKSTLLRSIYRALRPVAGSVHLDGDDVWQLSARETARRVAVVAQEPPSDFDFTVQEVVEAGRTPHKRMFERDSPDDLAITAAALERVGMSAFADRLVATLSGGEKQRVMVARALAQQSRVLILDEPTNHLDIRAQLDLLELVRGLGITIIAALHELNHATAYCDSVYVLSRGRVVASGVPRDTLTPELLRTVFGVESHGHVHPVSGRYHLLFAPVAEAAL